MSPFDKENRVITEALVSQNLLYFQKMHWPRNTNPKKKGNTPIRNIIRLLPDFLRVDVMRLRLWLYSKYFRIVIQANIAPNPIKVSFCSKISNLASINSLRMAVTAPINWKKFPPTLMINQVSKNLSLSKKPSSSHSFPQSTWENLSIPLYLGLFLNLIYYLDISQICLHESVRDIVAKIRTTMFTKTTFSEICTLLLSRMQSLGMADNSLSIFAKDWKEYSISNVQFRQEDHDLFSTGDTQVIRFFICRFICSMLFRNVFISPTLSISKGNFEINSSQFPSMQSTWELLTSISEQQMDMVYRRSSILEYCSNRSSSDLEDQNIPLKWAWKSLRLQKGNVLLPSSVPRQIREKTSS